jgi:hypothetical protein
VNAPFSSPEEAAQATPITWEVEIIKGWIPEIVGYLSILEQRAPKLKAMLSQSLGNFTSSMDLPPTLRLFLTDVNEPGGPFDISIMGNITTLHIAVGSLEARIGKGTLPCLRHLSIDCIDHDGVSWLQKDIHKFLEHVGSQLQTFHLRDCLTSAPLEPNLWEVLPNLKRIQLPYSWSGCSIPRNHPLQIIQISARGIWAADGGPVYLEDLFLCFSLEKRLYIRMDTTWGEELFTQLGESVAVIFDEYCTTRMVPFVDSNGQSFAQYIVFLITAFWKQPGRRCCEASGRSDYGARHF